MSIGTTGSSHLPPGNLEQVRAAFREQMAEGHAAEVWSRFQGRIGIVLAGGGGQGAYEAGVLLAFQDARVPTHILSGTSIGAINAATFAAHSDDMVGRAEDLAAGWSGLTPETVGIEWLNYFWMLSGLIAFSAGAGNFVRTLLAGRLEFRVDHPLVTWGCLGVLGLAIVLFHDHLPYLLYVLEKWWTGAPWTLRRRKLAVSVLGNLLVLGGGAILLESLDAIAGVRHLVGAYPAECCLAAAALALGAVLRKRWESSIGILLHRMFRLLLRPGLFANFERTTFLRRNISEERLRKSPIRVIFPATDLEMGPPAFFSNTAPDILAADRGADPEFVRHEIADSDDLLLALAASSALPIAFEPIRISGHLYADGGVSANRPLRPALRLGADVLFVVMMQPLGGPPVRVRTFIDVGLRAVAVLTGRNMITDREILQNVNRMCERLAARFDLRPEEVEVDLGIRRYRYVPVFTIHPHAPLPGSVLEFGGEGTARAILEGYRDATAQIVAFLDYAPTARFGKTRRVLQIAG